MGDYSKTGTRVIVADDKIPFRYYCTYKLTRA
jgi:hypothetical protein